MYTLTVQASELVKAGIDAHDLTSRGTTNKPRATAPLGIVTHTPSVTFSKRVFDAYVATHGRAPTVSEHEAAAAVRFDGLEYQPNGMIGPSGALWLLDADTQRVQHSGMLANGCPGGNIYHGDAWQDWAKPLGGDWMRHRRDPAAVYDFWLAAWPGARSPIDVYPWGRFPNEALGLDLLPDPITGEYTEAQRETWCRVVRIWASLHDFAIDPIRVTTHTLASPCERGTVLRHGKVIGMHWDPDARVWDHRVMVARAAAEPLPSP